MPSSDQQDLLTPSHSLVEHNDKLKFIGLMRLDLFLKASRLCSGRTQAQKFCDAGLVSVNRKPAKSAHPVKAGDELAIRTRTRFQVVRIAAVPATRNTPRNEAATLYEVLEDQRLADD